MDSHVLPMEVKPDKDYDRHNALSNVMGNQEYGIPLADVFCQENVHIKGNITYFPICLIAFLNANTSSREYIPA